MITMKISQEIFEVRQKLGWARDATNSGQHGTAKNFLFAADQQLDGIEKVLRKEKLIRLRSAKDFEEDVKAAGKTLADLFG